MTGGLVTSLIVIIMLIYGSIKIIQLITFHNPNVTEHLEKTVFDSSEQLDLNKIGFKLAFSVTGYHSRELKNDPRYVKYLVRIFGIKDGKEYEKFIPYHKCEEKDWAEFPPASKASSYAIEDIKKDPKRGMFCLDWSAQELLLYGNEKN